MKKVLRSLGSIVFLALIFVAGSLAYSTWRGYIGWYFLVNGQVVVNGRETTGYLHANTDKTLLMLTRTDDSQPETYLVSLGPERAVVDCGEWHPLRFLPFPVGHVNSPCSFFTVDPAKLRDPPVTSTLERRPRYVEFSTASGKKVRAQW
jgi:hypothetical protein